ncbi:MAG: hypothetical protein KDB40_10320 [Acidimicrobiales bacterium]|nr:hypothetical protein [Acidimicrobiales bacterium]MCB9394395.1 hypothetical protein [Acidimicrobiaceae bacterium]
MVVWFVATSVLAVYYVFTDVRFDYRWLIVGALLPDAVDLWTGGAWVMHGLPSAVVALALVMVVTAGRRPIRRRLIAIPIGMMLHLVFDGAFTDTDVFWWPFTGGFGDAEVPVVARGWWNVPLEVLGVGLLVWGWRLFGLADVERRRHFWRTGRLTSVR